MTDSGTPNLGADEAAQITVNGVNAAPTLSPRHTAAVDPARDREFSPVGVAIADATASIADEEGKISQVEVDISSGYQSTAGNRARAAHRARRFRPAAARRNVELRRQRHPRHPDRELRDAGHAGAGDEVLLQVQYINQIGDFSLDVATDDTRTISVRVRDHDGAWSNTATHEVNIAADVVDTTNINHFVGSHFNDVIQGAAGDDVMTGGQGADTFYGGTTAADSGTHDAVDYGNAAEAGGHGVVVNLADAAYDLDNLDPIYNNVPNNDPTIGAHQATDTYGDTDTLNGIENATGTAYDDVFINSTDAAVANVFEGGGTGPSNENAAHEVVGDTVVYAGNVGDWGIQVVPGSNDDLTVTKLSGAGAGTVDTLNNIEHVVIGNTTFDLTKAVFVYNNGYLVNTFDTITDAVNAADGLTAQGTGLVVEAGHNGVTSFTEGTITATQAMTIKGFGGTPTVHAEFDVSGTLDGLFLLDHLNVDATGHQYGLFVSANSHAFAGSVTLDHVHISNAGTNGFAYVEQGNGSTPTHGDTIGAVSILDSAFSNNATANTGSNGRGDILLFGYNHDLTITNVDISSPGAWAQKAIRCAASRASATPPMSGRTNSPAMSRSTAVDRRRLRQDAIAFYRLAGFASFTGSGNSVDITRSPNASPNATLEPWAVINFDEDGGQIDLSNFFSHASNLASPDGIVPAVPSWIAQEQGLAGNDTFTGTAGTDLLVGRGGDDTLNGAGGDDVIVYSVGDGHDTVDGGSGTDTEIVNGTASAETFNINAVSPTQLGINIEAGANPATLPNAEVVTANVEEIVINTGNGGDTVIISGDLSGTGVATSTISVNGGSGNDTVDAGLCPAPTRSTSSAAAATR